MKKIEREMIGAISSGLYTGQGWNGSNTSTVANYLPAGAEVMVYLHGNHIATVRREDGITTVQLSDAGWQTATTKSRLNAIATAFNVKGVYQRDWAWYFKDGGEFTNWQVQEAA